MAEILRANLLTRFNFILATLLVVILVVGEPQDALFGIVLVANALIGIAQETRAKRTLDRLALLNAPLARVVRSGIAHGVPMDDIVLDDLIEARPGDQIVADRMVGASDALEVDESLLTGESHPVHKTWGRLPALRQFRRRRFGALPGHCGGRRRLCPPTGRGGPSILPGALGSNGGDQPNSPLHHLGHRPGGPPTMLSQLHANDSVDVVLSDTVAPLVGMMPQGLVLLTSITFAVAAVGLARHQVLGQQLPAVEGSAQVDVVCFDKTGTLTDGTLAYDHVVRLAPNVPIEEALGFLGQADDSNETLAVIARRFPVAPWIAGSRVAFSSARKWSGVDFAEHRAWVLGAPEILVGDHPTAAIEAARLAIASYRVLALARSKAPMDGDQLPVDLEPMALVVLGERLRNLSGDLRHFWFSPSVQPPLDRLAG